MKPSNGPAGRIFLSLIGVMLIAVGGVFSWLMIRSYMNASESRQWEQTDALVLRSVIDERIFKGSPREFRLNVLYGYQYEGVEYTSDSISPRGAKWTRKVDEVVELAKVYDTNSAHTAWVNPADPEEAILEHDTKAAGYTVWFPAVIAIGGVGMLWGAFKPNS